MALNGPRKPAAYVRYLPPGCSVSSGEHHYYIHINSDVLVHVDGRWNVVPNLHNQSDPFLQGAVAEVPNGLSYIKTGDIWVLDPIPATMPVILTDQVLDNPEYCVIMQTPYIGVKLGNFYGADEPAFVFPHGNTEKVQGKISIIVDVPLMCPSNGQKRSLGSSSQVNTAVTKGHLGKGVVREVETALATSNHTLLGFINGNFTKEISLEDLFLVNLVQRSKGTFQPTIAVRVP